MVQPQRQKNKTGPKSVFRPEFIQQAYELSLLGLRNIDIANVWSIPVKTLEDWISKKPDLKDAIHEGRHLANAKVAASLYKKAIGFWIEEVKYFTVKTSKNKSKLVPIKVKKYFPPDTVAAVKILSIRDRARWSDVQKIQHEHTGALDITHLQNQIDSTSHFTNKELKAIKKIGINKAIIQNSKYITSEN